RVTNEEALFVVVGVDEPAGNAIGTVAADLAGRGIKDIDAEHLHLNIVFFRWQDFDVGLTKNDEQIALAGILEFIGHMEIRIHASLKYVNATELVKLGRLAFVAKGACNQYIKIRIACLASRRD